LTFAQVVDRPLIGSSPFRWQMGVRALSHEFWLQPDDACEGDLATKAALIAARPDEMVAWLPGSESAGEEVGALVAADLAERGLSMGSAGEHPIDRAGRSVQEDLCLMQRVDDEWVLTAGSVCFPTRWVLRDKIGRSLAGIHEPVPDYDHIGPQVDRFFDRMLPDSLAWRLNWSLVDERARRLDPRGRQAPIVGPTDLGRDLFLRVERQTLRRLVEHDATVFGIRIHVWPLGRVVEDLLSEGFVDSLATMPIDVATYKNLEGVRPALLKWLSRGASF
jgi:hypothetical protein